MARYPLHAYKVGDWGRARMLFSRLAMTSVTAAAVMRDEARSLKGRIVEGLWSGSFADQYNWPPLSEMTIERRVDKENPMLIDTTSMVRSIRVLPMGWNVLGVGIPKGARNSKGESVAQIAMVHEQGLGANNWGYRIPPRPFWRSQYSISRRNITAKMMAAIKAHNMGWRSPTRSLRALRLPTALAVTAGAHGGIAAVQALQAMGPVVP